MHIHSSHNSYCFIVTDLATFPFSCLTKYKLLLVHNSAESNTHTVQLQLDLVFIYRGLRKTHPMCNTQLGIT